MQSTREQENINVMDDIGILAGAMSAGGIKKKESNEDAQGIDFEFSPEETANRPIMLEKINQTMNAAAKKFGFPVEIFCYLLLADFCNYPEEDQGLYLLQGYASIFYNGHPEGVDLNVLVRRIENWRLHKELAEV